MLEDILNVEQFFVPGAIFTSDSLTSWADRIKAEALDEFRQRVGSRRFGETSRPVVMARAILKGLGYQLFYYRKHYKGQIQYKLAPAGDIFSQLNRPIKPNGLRPLSI